MKKNFTPPKDALKRAAFMFPLMLLSMFVLANPKVKTGKRGNSSEGDEKKDAPDAYDCSKPGSLLFRQDFGGGSASAPKFSLTSLPAGMTTYSFRAGDKPNGNTGDAPGANVSKDEYALSKTSNYTTNFPAWYNTIQDHTGDVSGVHGYMAVFNGTKTFGNVFSIPLTQLCPGTKLNFSVWAVSMVKSATGYATPNLVFRLINPADGSTVDSLTAGTIPNASPTWKQYAKDFVVPPNTTSVILQVVNVSTNTNGNDFALDDIEVRSYTPPVAINPDVSAKPFCKGELVALRGVFTDECNVFNSNISYKWFKSSTGDLLSWDSWTEVASERSTTPDSLIIHATDAVSYYRVVAGSADNVANNRFFCCAVSDVVTVTVNDKALPVLTITNPSSVCAPSTIDLTAANVTTGSDAGELSYWTDDIASEALSTPATVAAGTYYIKLINSNNCSIIKPVTATVNNTPSLSVTVPSIVCSPATVDLTAAAVTTGSDAGELSYWIDDAAATALSTPASVEAGTYYIKLTNDNNCSTVQSVTVTSSNAPNLAVTAPSIVCSPATVDLTAAAVTTGSDAGELSYWTDEAATTALSTPTSAEAGTYYIKLTNDNNCSTIQSVTVTSSNAPNLAVTSPSIVCSPSTVDLTAASVTTGSDVGELSYWTDEAATTTLATPTSVEAGTYYIKLTNDNNCSTVQSVTVTSSNAPNLIVTAPSIVCSPATVDLTAAAVTTGSDAGELSYWIDEAATTTLSTPASVGTGTYYIKLTNDNNCSTVQSVTVTSSNAPNLVVTSPSIVCSPATVDLTAASVTTGSDAGELSYWTDEAATTALSTPASVEAGTYYIKLTNDNNCSTIQSVTVTSSNAPNLTVTSPSMVCSPATVDLTAAAVTTGSDAGELSYWTDDAATTALSTPTSVGAGTYYIKLTNDNNCSTVQSVTVTASNTPNLAVTAPSIVCSPATVDLTAATITTGSDAGELSYWTDDAATTALSTPTSVGAGTYYIKLTNDNNCSTVQSVTVTASNTPNLAVTAPSIVCSPATVDLTAAAVTTGSDAGELSYWADDAATTALSTPTSVGAGTYYIKLINSNNCSTVQPVTVIASNAPNLAVTPPSIACSPATADLTAATVTIGSDAGELSYWTDEAATTALSTPTSVEAGTYYIKLTNDNNCSTIQSLTITASNAPNLVITAPAATCSVVTADLTAATVTTGSDAGELSYWTDETATTALSTPASVGAGTYYIKLTNDNNCSVIKPVTISIADAPKLVITAPSAVCPSAKVDLTATTVTTGSDAGELSYWTNAAATDALTMPTLAGIGTYYIKLTNSNNCSVVGSVTINSKQTTLQTDIIAPSSVTVCGNTSATITASTSITDKNILFKWYAGADLTTAIATGTKYTVTTPGRYYITVQSTNLCENIQTALPVDVYASADCGSLIPSNCAVNGSLLFKEDFGGNSTSDPAISTHGIEAITDSTHYNYVTTLPPQDGEYTICKTVPAGKGFPRWYTGMSDHTYPGDTTKGYFILFNAEDKPSEFYTLTLNNLCAGVKLYFSSWVYNMYKLPREGSAGIEPNLTYTLEDLNTHNTIATYTTGKVPNESPQWKEYGFNFTVPEGVSSVRLHIKNNVPGGTGNDFAMDDISVYACTPPVSVSGTAKYCGKGKLDLSADYTDDGTIGPDYKYQWFYSKTGNLTTWDSWQPVGAPGATLSDSAITGYYRVVVGTQGNIDARRFFCCAASTPKYVSVDELPKLVITNPSAVYAPGTVDITAASVTAGSDAGIFTYWADSLATIAIQTPAAVPGVDTTYYIKLTSSETDCFVTGPVVLNSLPVYIGWKTADKVSVKANDTITYTVHVKNTGKIDINSIHVADKIPAYTSYITGSGGQYDATKDSVLFDLPNVNLVPDASTSVTFKVKAASDLSGVASINNVANIRGDNGAEVPTDASNMPAGDTSGAVIPVNIDPIYIGWKTADKVSVKANDTITYTIHVKNTGTIAINSIHIGDKTPSNTTYIAGSGGVYDAAKDSVLFDLPNVNLVPDASTSVTFKVKAAGDLSGVTSINNVANIRGDGGAEVPTDASNMPVGDTSGAVIPVVAVSFTTWKTVTDANGDKKAQAGEELTYTIYVHNTGSSTIDKVVITDTLPLYTSYVSGGVYDATTNIVTLSGTDIAGNSTAAYSFVVKVAQHIPANTIIRNQASTNGDGTIKPTCPVESADCQGSTTDIPVDLSFVDLRVIKISENKLIGVKGKLTYTITVENLSSNTAYNVTVKDTLPSSVGYISASVDLGQLLNGRVGIVEWAIDSLVAGNKGTMKLTVEALQIGKVINTAVVDSDNPDSNPADNTSTDIHDVEGLIIPNTITPNGDGYNDFFEIFGLENYPGTELTIYNRWGSEVYRSTNYDNKWNGSGLNVGTYYYIIKLPARDGNSRKTYKGWIELIRK